MDASRRIERLEREVEALNLKIAAIWKVVGREQGLLNRDLEEIMSEIDAQDGYRDGRITLSAANCSSCGRESDTKRVKCVYCGADLV